MDSEPVKGQAAIVERCSKPFPHVCGALQMAHNFPESLEDNSPEALQTLAVVDEALELAEAALGRT